MNSSYQTPNSKWLTEQCPVCCSVNHIFFDQSIEAWECYHCLYRYWIDDYSKEQYMLRAGCLECDADAELHSMMSRVKFGLGHYEREN